MDDGLWVRRYVPCEEAPLRLVCLPHASGSATFYRPVAQTLAPAIEVLAIQYPGRQDRMNERCLESIHELADCVFTHIRGLSGPIALFGHSMGATLAFEVALRLESAGLNPLCVFASGRQAPSRQRTSRLHLLSDEELLADLRATAGTDPALLADVGLRAVVLKALRADYKALETYSPAPGAKLTCPIIAMVGENDPYAGPHDAPAWGDHTNGPFTVRVFPGDHFYLVQHAAAVLATIQDQLIQHYPA
ncbi:MAG TPA: alpha/beta fold hydrolase [Candidatus Limnocylindrales bacterium]|nr:alpha/beta fold hydrolase [Candidatus Limnocylindrales bacterium]